MANTASYTYIGGANMYSIRVNGNHVYYTSSAGTADTITTRLNRIFGDPDRDLDFITPSYYNGCYVVCCPKVRRNAGLTYLKNGTSKNMKLYENTIFADSTTNANQTAILTITGSSNPWYEALLIANNIRNYITANFNPLHGSQYIYRLAAPTNNTVTVDRTLYTNANLNFFGEICQGVVNNDNYICTHSYFGGTVERISGTSTANGEVFHPMDLVAAVSSSDFSAYKNKYVKVTYQSLSIVVKIVTTMPPTANGIELSFGAWKALGFPPTGSNNVKIELMK